MRFVGFEQQFIFSFLSKPVVLEKAIEKAIGKAIGRVSTVVRFRRFFSAVRSGRFSLASVSTAVLFVDGSPRRLGLDGSLSRRLSSAFDLIRR